MVDFNGAGNVFEDRTVCGTCFADDVDMTLAHGKDCQPCGYGQFGEQPTGETFSTTCQTCPSGRGMPGLVGVVQKYASTPTGTCTSGVTDEHACTTDPSCSCYISEGVYYTKTGYHKAPGYRCGDGAGSAVTQISCADKESYQCYHITDGVCYGFSEFTIVEDRDSTAYVNSLASGGPCQTCFIGRFSNSDSSICQVCGKGMYQDVPGALTCKSCPYGWYTTKGSGEDGHDSISDCTACPAGKFSEERFMDDDSACKDCPDGQGSDGLNRWYCRTCPAGWYKFRAIFDWNVGTPTNDCARCPTGRFQNEEGTQTCKRCSAGEYQDEEAQNECDNCPGGWFEYFDRTKCQQCDTGKYSNAGGSQCELCAIGKYSDTLGSASCKNCAVGQFQSSVGASTCMLCSPGKKSPSLGSSSCASCPVGRFANSFGAITCQACSAGQYQSTTGQPTCQSCPLGFFSVETLITTSVVNNTQDGAIFDGLFQSLVGNQLFQENEKEACKAYALKEGKSFYDMTDAEKSPRKPYRFQRCDSNPHGAPSPPPYFCPIIPGEINRHYAWPFSGRDLSYIRTLDPSFSPSNYDTYTYDGKKKWVYTEMNNPGFTCIFDKWNNFVAFIYSKDVLYHCDQGDNWCGCSVQVLGTCLVRNNDDLCRKYCDNRFEYDLPMVNPGTLVPTTIDTSLSVYHSYNINAMENFIEQTYVYRHTSLQPIVACQTCPINFYQDAEGQSKCNACPEGRFAPAGASHFTMCAVCGNGQFSDTSGCTDCPQGWYTDDETSKEVCTACPAGFGNNEAGSGWCGCLGSKEYGRTSSCFENHGYCDLQFWSPYEYWGFKMPSESVYHQARTLGGSSISRIPACGHDDYGVIFKWNNMENAVYVGQSADINDHNDDVNFVFLVTCPFGKKCEVAINKNKLGDSDSVDTIITLQATCQTFTATDGTKYNLGYALYHASSASGGNAFETGNSRGVSSYQITDTGSCPAMGTIAS